MTPDQDLSARLLPCPFCGGEAGSCPDPNHSTGWDVGCFSGACDIEPHVWSIHHETAIEQWNRRVPADHERAVQAAVAKAVEACEDEIYGLIDDRFSGALALRDAARKDRDTAGAAIHNEAVQTLADLRAAIRSRGVAG